MDKISIDIIECEAVIFLFVDKCNLITAVEANIHRYIYIYIDIYGTYIWIYIYID